MKIKNYHTFITDNVKFEEVTIEGYYYPEKYVRALTIEDNKPLCNFFVDSSGEEVDPALQEKLLRTLELWSKDIPTEGYYELYTKAFRNIRGW